MHRPLKIGNTSSAKLVGGGPGFAAAFGFAPSCPTAWKATAATASTAIPRSKDLMVGFLSAFRRTACLSRGGDHLIRHHGTPLKHSDSKHAIILEGRFLCNDQP
jgi:hypothetical protein